MNTLFSLLVLAAGLHTGIPVRGVPGLGEPTFDLPETGWTAPVAGGWARVYVGRTESEAQRWLSQASLGITRQAPALPNLADEAWGDGESLVGFRDGNVAAVVRCERGAGQIARVLLEAIADTGSPWPTAELVKGEDGRYSLRFPNLAHASALGGGPDAQGLYPALPRELLAWDTWGRGVRLTP